jgi:hypothetical protein
MTNGAAFLLEPGHLGSDAHGAVSLLAAFAERLDDLVGADGYDLLDAGGLRLALPKHPFAFTRPVEAFDVDAAAVPCRLAVYDAAAAGRVAAAFPALRRTPLVEPDGVAFELEPRHLGRDVLGIVHLAPAVQHALDAFRRRVPEARVELFDGDGVPCADRPNSFSEQSEPLVPGPHSEVALNGFEPRYLAFADARTADAFARDYPGLSRCRLADLERTWRRARRESR